MLQTSSGSRFAGTHWLTRVTQGTFIATVGALCAVVYQFYPDRVSLPGLTHMTPALTYDCSPQSHEHSQAA